LVSSCSPCILICLDMVVDQEKTRGTELQIGGILLLYGSSSGAR
jgi:hypothetical protein